MVSETELYSSPSLEEYLTDDEMEEYLENLKTKIPSFIVELLKNNLKNRKLTKSQLDRIVTRVTDLYLGKRPDDKKAEELTGKINELSKKLDALMKVAAISSATKISEDIKEEITKLEGDSEEESQVEELEDIDSSAMEDSDVSEEGGEEQTPQDKLKCDETEEDVESTATSPEESISKPDISKKTDNVSTAIDMEVINMANGLPNVSDKKYRLEELPEDTLSTMLVFKWLEFLISRVGLSNLIDILDYYYNLGWISEKVVNRLIKISKNMKYLNEEFRKPMDKMISEDHIVSLLYVEKLAGRPIPVDELESMDREITRIKKWADELQFI